MFGFIKSITTAGNRLARTLTALADTCEEVNGGLREQLGMDRVEGSSGGGRGGRKQVEAKAVATSGEVG